MKQKILVVDDDPNMTDVLSAGLKKLGVEVVARHNGEEAFQLLTSEDFDVVVTDLNMRGINGLELCERIAANRPDVPVIVITAFGSLDTAIAAIRVGAYDFIPKPFDLEFLAIVVRRAIQHRALQDEVKRLRHALDSEKRTDSPLGDSAAIRKIEDLIDRVSESMATVLVTGESGTGKERVARALHDRSSRRNGPFVAVDCAALPENLLESELFGHASGAFTDARVARTGLLVQANQGTLFLDEIGEMPPALQPKLLRALQERRVRPLGSNHELAFDARIVAATNRDLETEIEAGRFREDLFYRINVIHIEVPPLRARGGDVLLLGQHFVEHASSRSGDRRVTGISPAVAARLLAYSWPGNVRELQNCIERAVAVANFEQLTVEDLPERIRNYRSSPIIVESHDPADFLPMEEVERRYLLRVLEAVGGNKTRAAEVLGLDRRTLYRKLERYSSEIPGE